MLVPPFNTPLVVGGLLHPVGVDASRGSSPRARAGAYLKGAKGSTGRLALPNMAKHEGGAGEF